MKVYTLSRFLWSLLFIASAIAYLEAAIVLFIPHLRGSNGTIVRLGRQVRDDCDRSNQFRCDSGQCISLDSQCDGTADCNDKSDETNTCKDLNCPAYTFRCNYGACVSASAKCDGVRDCIDNSDEQICTGQK